eukprot:scaffold1012_cov278-Pavlova_lutheri.AAC.2
MRRRATDGRRHGGRTDRDRRDRTDIRAIRVSKRYSSPPRPFDRFWWTPGPSSAKQPMERPAGIAYASTGDAMDQTNATTGLYVLENGWMQKLSVVGAVAKELEDG